MELVSIGRAYELFWLHPELLAKGWHLFSHPLRHMGIESK